MHKYASEILLDNNPTSLDLLTCLRINAKYIAMPTTPKQDAAYLLAMNVYINARLERV